MMGHFQSPTLSVVKLKYRENELEVIIVSPDSDKIKLKLFKDYKICLISTSSRQFNEIGFRIISCCGSNIIIVTYYTIRSPAVN